MRLATACAMVRLRSGGYAACDAECHSCCPWDPPTRETCVRCVHVRELRRPSAGCRPGVQRKVVYFCALAPRAHCGKVTREHESRACRSVMQGKSQMGPWRACKNSGDATCPLSAGCSS
eukprot:4709929-Pleurochrysis_carterae.AAC.1